MRIIYELRDELGFSFDKSEVELNNTLNDFLTFNLTVCESHNLNDSYNKIHNLIAKQVIWDKFYFVFENNIPDDINNNLNNKEIYYKKSYVNLDDCIEETQINSHYNYDLLGKIISNSNINQIYSRNNYYNKAKYLRFNLNFDLKKLESLEKLFYPCNKNFINNASFDINHKITNKINLIEEYNSNYIHNQKKIYVNLLDYFITFSKKLFIIHNHINFKVYFNNEKQRQSPIVNREGDYKLIYEETFDNIARLEFSDLSNFLSVYLRVEKENIFKAKGEFVSVLLAFCEFKPSKKDECNNLEILFVDNKQKNLLLGQEFLNYFNNFIEDNQHLKNLLVKFDIVFDNPKAFLEKINPNNPFKAEISANYLESNQIDLKFISESRFKYLWNIPIRNPNGHNVKFLINIETAGKLEISNDEIYFELLQKDFNSILNNIVNEITNDKGNKFLLNADERKVLFNIESNINKISSSVLPILVLSENEKLINLMGKFFKDIKAEEETQQSERIKANLKFKKQANAHDVNEVKKYELIENLIDAENSDFKIQEMFKRKIEKLLKNKLSKD